MKRDMRNAGKIGDVGGNAFIQVLKIGPFRNLWLSQLFSQVFLNLLFFSLVIRVYDLTKSNVAVSVLVFLFTIPNIFLGALAGVLVDRFGRKPVMFLSHFLRVFAVLAFLISPETLGWIYLLVFLISVISQFFFPAEAGTIPQLVTNPKLLLTANSLFSVTFFASMILGNVLAGPFLIIFGHTYTFLPVAGAFVLAALFVSRLPGNGKKTAEERLTFSVVLADFMKGIDHLYHQPLVRRGIFLLALSQVSLGILGTIAPGFADKVLAVPSTSISLLIMAPAAAGMILGAVVLGQFLRKTPRLRLIRLGVWAAAGSLVLYSFVDKLALGTHLPFLWLNFILLLSMGAANAFLDIPTNTMIQENTPEPIRSRIYGVVSSVIGAAAIVPIVLSGALADFFGVRTVMVIMGIILLGLATKVNDF